MRNKTSDTLRFPFVSAFLSTTAFYLVYLIILRPGYYIIDDPKMIQIVSGYPAAPPAPFMVFSNVLLGLGLQFLYKTFSGPNWEILLFVAVNFLSIWGINYTLLSSRTTTAYQKLAGILAATGCSAYFQLQLTFTFTAAFTIIAGTCLIWSAAHPSSSHRKLILFWGIALIVAGSIIRIDALAIILPLFAAMVALNLPSLVKNRYITSGLLITGGLIAACTIFEQAYLHLSPGWNSFYTYTAARSSLHDTHRLQNLHGQIKAIGWSKNDQELFARWFYFDKQTYSLKNLEYLTKHTSATSHFGRALVNTFLEHVLSWLMLPYILITTALGLFVISTTSSIKTLLTLIIMMSIALMENLYLAWAMKDPDRVLLSSLAGVAIFGIVLVDWPQKLIALDFHKVSIRSVCLYIAVVCASTSIGMFAYQSGNATNRHIEEQQGYKQILMDLNELQATGKLASNAVMISTSHGLPLEWADPFALDFPAIPYLDTGWITFSPVYEQTLEKYDIKSLPDALYQRNNLYIFTDSNFTGFLHQYYQEHENINVIFHPIYAIANVYRFPGYENIQLYKITKAK